MSRPRLLDLFCGAGGAAMGTDTELAWASGFFDGEGSVSLHVDKRAGRHKLFHMDIEQVDARPLLRFQEAVGGAGRITLRPPRGNSRAIHRLTMGHVATIATISALWPYLSEPKREQVAAVADAIEAIG